MPSAFCQPVAWMVTSRARALRGRVRLYGGARRWPSPPARAPELVWLLEHPPLYTAGTSAKPEDLLAPARFPVHRTGRGGQFTYHGPGQRVAYVMLDVKRRFGDVRAYVASLEGWIIDSARRAGCRGRTATRAGRRLGAPTRHADDGGTHDKIAAIGVRLSRWVSSHGISLNVAPDLSHYAGIVPCGIRDGGVTSLADLGLTQDADGGRRGPARRLRAALRRDRGPSRAAGRR